MKDLAKLLANFNVKLKVSEETKPGEVQKALWKWLASLRNGWYRQ